jgi:hypothetical protein
VPVSGVATTAVSSGLVSSAKTRVRSEQLLSDRNLPAGTLPD